jgi:hypothetical protein
MSELVNPLAEIIRRAAESKTEGGPASKLKKRYSEASEEVLIVADCSSSMDDHIGNSGLKKSQHLAIALRDVLSAHPNIRLIAFDTTAEEIANIPAWLDALALQAAGKPTSYPVIISGGTNLDQGLKLAATLKPRKTIVISDGQPTCSEQAALDEADKMTGRIDTIYCGADTHPAVDFLRKLARLSGGVQVTWDGYKTEISGAIRGLLTA